MRQAKLCLKDILAAMEAIESFVSGMDFDEFDRDLKTKSAVLAQLAMIGEAVKLLPPTVRESHPEVAWKDMAGMRDRLVHGYFRVDYHLIWQTATRVIPAEKHAIHALLNQDPAIQ